MTDIKRLPAAFIEQCIEKENNDFAIAKELVEYLFRDMAKLCKKYDNDSFFDLPYTYSERRLDSVLLPALSKLCDSKVLVELPATRQCNTRRFQVNESSGRIDYWCVYKGYSFVIELKHSYDCFTTPTTRDDKVTSRWIKMNEQLQSIEKEIKRYVEETKGVIRLGLHVITSYSDKEPDNQLIAQFDKSIPSTIERFLRDLSRPYPSLKPDLLICWKIPHQMVLKGAQTFPGLWIIAKIYPAIRHHGSKL